MQHFSTPLRTQEALFRPHDPSARDPPQETRSFNARKQPLNVSKDRYKHTTVLEILTGETPSSQIDRPQISELLTDLNYRLYHLIQCSSLSALPGARCRITLGCYFLAYDPSTRLFQTSDGFNDVGGTTVDPENI